MEHVLFIIIHINVRIGLRHARACARTYAISRFSPVPPVPSVESSIIFEKIWNRYPHFCLFHTCSAPVPKRRFIILGWSAPFVNGVQGNKDKLRIMISPTIYNRLFYLLIHYSTLIFTFSPLITRGRAPFRFG